MNDHAISESRAWTATTIDDRASWYYPVPEACLTAWRRVQRRSASAGALSTPGLLDDSSRSTCATALGPVLAAIEQGRGFAIINGPPALGHGLETGPSAGLEAGPSAADARVLYWVVGQGLGRPFAQNVQGTVLYDVRDTGQDLTQGARFSVTNYESSFHTDNSFGTDILDYVGLLCLQCARSGGRSQMVSGWAVYNELLTRHPDVLTALTGPFHVDRRGGTRPGDAPTIQFPIITRDGSELIFRYLRYWIEAGHEKAGQPLTSAQVKALNALDDIMKRPDFIVEFDLKPGQMYFINNRWILHNRTAFEDYPELERRRHLVRLWLQKH